jgi:hypothetical protein
MKIIESSSPELFLAEEKEHYRSFNGRRVTAVKEISRSLINVQVKSVF